MDPPYWVLETVPALACDYALAQGPGVNSGAIGPGSTSNAERVSSGKVVGEGRRGRSGGMGG